MSYREENKRSGGVGFLSLLTLLLIGLKLTGYITWSWISVLAPMWLPPAVIALIFLLLVVGVLIASVYERIYNRIKQG